MRLEGLPLREGHPQRGVGSMGGDPPGVNTEWTQLFVLEFTNIFFQIHILNFHCQDLIMKLYVLCVQGNLNLLFLSPHDE